MKKKILLIDIDHAPLLPDHLIYSALQIEKILPDFTPVILKLDETGKNKKVLSKINEEVVSILFWHQNWVESTLIHKMLYLANEIKRTNADIKIITGGYLPTLSPDIYRNEECFDAVLVGYPWDEKLIEDLFVNKAKGILTSNHDAGFPDSFDLSKAEKFIDPDRFFKRVSDKVISSYSFSYSCNNACPFCFNYGFLKCGGGIIKSFNTIEREIDFLRSKYKVERIESKDSNIFISKEFGLKVLDYFSKTSEISLNGNLDIMVRDLSEEVLDLLTKSGVKYIFLGFETFNEEGRDKLNKPFSLDKFADLVSHAESKDVFFLGNILLGITKDSSNLLTKADVQKEKVCVVSWLKKHPNLSIQMRLFMPLLGTPQGDQLWNEAKGDINFDLKSYSTLIDVLRKSKKFDPQYPIPSCYGSIELIDYIAQISRSLRVLNTARSQRHFLYNYSKKSYSKFFANLRCNYLLYLFDKEFYKLIQYENFVADILRYFLDIPKKVYEKHKINI